MNKLPNSDMFMFFGHNIDQQVEVDIFARKKIDPQYIFVNKNISLQKSKQIWENIIKDFLENSKNNKIVVPLSGGLDSRLILAGLLKHINAKDISTYTFGPENSLDFKIGNKIAKSIGTNHFSSPIKIEDYNYDNELKWAGLLKSPTTLFYHPPLNVIEEFQNFNYWYGFMGDPLAGSHLMINLSDYESAIKYYFKKYGAISESKAKKYNINLDEISSKIKANIDLNNNLNVFENIDFNIRQQQYIKPHVVFSKYNTLPFLDQKWVDFMLNIPDNLRQNEVFYREFMLKSYPEIFNLPCKNNLGYKLGSKLSLFPKVKMKLFPKQKNTLLNYVDFDLNLRSNNEFSNFIKDLIFTNQGVGNFSKKQIQVIWKDFLCGEVNFGLILNIASYAILTNIKK